MVEGQTKSRGLEVGEGRTYLRVPHKDGILSFATPAFSNGGYVSIGMRILDAKLELPTIEQTASLVHAAWQDPDETYQADIISKLMTNYWFWGFNELLYVPGKGVYIRDRPEVKKGRAVMNKSELVKKLEAGDPSVRFVPFGYKMGVQSYGELAKNPFIQALAGEEGAEKLAEVAGKYKNKPYVSSYKLEEVNRLTSRVATLGSDSIGVGFYLGSCYRDIRGGYAFGVSREKSVADTVQKGEDVA